VKPEECPKFDECQKVKMVLDKDMLDFQYQEAIRSICSRCDEGEKVANVVMDLGPGEKEHND